MEPSSGTSQKVYKFNTQLNKKERKKADFAFRGNLSIFMMYYYEYLEREPPPLTLKKKFFFYSFNCMELTLRGFLKMETGGWHIF